MTHEERLRIINEATTAMHRRDFESNLVPDSSRRLNTLLEVADLMPEVVRALSRADSEVAALEAERDEARAWVRKLHESSSVLTCVYCGHAYPPGTPPSNAEALTSHISECAKHPMRKLRQALEEITAGGDVKRTASDAARYVLIARTALSEGGS